MRQRIADSLQVTGAIGLTVAATLSHLLLGLAVASALAVVAGVHVERS